MGPHDQKSEVLPGTASAKTISPLSDDDLIPIAEVARGRGVKPKTVLETAKRDPAHPPLISLTDNLRARKFLRRGDEKAYQRRLLAKAEQRQAERIARNAAKQVAHASHNA